MPIQAVSFKGSEKSKINEFENMKNEGELEYYNAISNAMTEVMDSYEASAKIKEDKKNRKNIFGIVLSIATAGILAFAGGKIVTDKLSKVFPKTAGKFNNGLSKLSESGFWTKAKEFCTKHSESAKPAEAKIGKFFQSAKNTLMKKSAAGVELAQNGLKSEKALSNIVGGALAAGGVARIATVDGNGDGVKDITQKNVNAYKSAIQGIDIIDAIAKTIA